VAVLFIDLDHFKTVNDSLGHGAGDDLLRTVARRLLSTTRGSDTVARLGGDEFAILLEDLAGPEVAAVAAERVLGALATPIVLDADEPSGADAAGSRTRSVTVGASVGIASAAGADTPDALVRNADLALYAAKGGGRARAVAFTPAMHEAAVARLELEADLRAAIRALGGPRDAAGAGLSLVYQPIVDIATERVTGVEALLRWTRPDGRSVSPAAFIPVAEETGLIVPLGRWVLEQACRQAVAWEALGAHAHVAMSVNVSGRQIQEAAFIDEVRAVLDATGIAPRRLVLEITEGVMMRDAAQTLARLRALKALGVRIAVDDFGTGYSSLGYLRQFPVDVLKIDKSFVDGVGHGGDESVLATAIVSLGTALALMTVAEGVEDEAQLARLRELGCARGQGYLFARPMPPDAVAERLAGAAAGAAPAVF
jgi:diguanylate cyclase (GGDEF)-like protein